MSLPMLTIVVPVYNIRDYLPRCVDSLLKQDNAEILLIDDGSTDGSAALCDDYAARDSRVTVYHKPNGGLSDARNYGLARAHGEYVVFMDGDDWINDGACASMMRDALSLRADMVIGHAHFLKQDPVMDFWESDVARHFQYHQVYTGRDYLLGCLQTSDIRVEVGRNLYRTAFLREHQLFFLQGVLHEDEEFTPRALLAARRVVLSDQVFFTYDNTRAGSIIHSPALAKRRAGDRLAIYQRLSALYRTVTPKKLRRLLEDNLCWKYLDVFARYKCIRPEATTSMRLHILRCAYKPRRRIKALLFVVSPKLYYTVFTQVATKEA